MTKAEHTPGPWKSSPQSGTIGHCFFAQVWGVDGQNLASLEPTSDEREATANARLIAAAPDLLDALKLIAAHQENVAGSMAKMSTTWMIATRAIEKAELQ